MEAVGGILVMLGVRIREISAARISILAGALWVRSSNGWVFSNPGGGWEYPAYWVRRRCCRGRHDNLRHP